MTNENKRRLIWLYQKVEFYQSRVNARREEHQHHTDHCEFPEAKAVWRRLGRSDERFAKAEAILADFVDSNMN